MVELTEWICTDCGRKHEFSTYGPKECLDCGAFLSKADEVPLTSNDKIRELIEDWRDTAAMEHPDEKDVFNARCDAWREAADELEALIEDTQAGDADE